MSQSPTSQENISRRSMLKIATVGAAALAAVPAMAQRSSRAALIDQIEAFAPQGNIKQSVSKWCFGNIPYAEFIPICKKLGMVGIDLVNPSDWAMMLENDMIVTMGNVPGAGIGDGFNREQNHERLIQAYEQWIPVAGENKVPNLICFSGNRRGISDEEGIEKCVLGLKKLMPLAEQHNVTLCLELLNSKVDHGDYQADRTPWAAEIVNQVGSERLKLLYDIYHMQIMEGDLIRTIGRYHNVIGHYHTAGNPGRRDLDEQQEIFYPAVMDAILATGYTGFVAHEFLPRNGIHSLRDAVVLCDR